MGEGHETGPIRHCPSCGGRMEDDSLLLELWVGWVTVWVVWCARCHWSGEIHTAPFVGAGSQPEEDPDA